jgi:Ion channel
MSKQALTFPNLPGVLPLLPANWISTGVLATGFTGYLLVAIGFAQLYAVLADLLPGAFNNAAPADAPTAFFTYFSLVTIASLGFGDIVLVQPFVRVVAALEGVCGLFYIAVVVARLVAAYSPRQALATPPTPDTPREEKCERRQS